MEAMVRRDSVAGNEAGYWARWFIAVSLVAGAASFVLPFSRLLSVLVVLAFAAAIFGLRRPVLGLYGVAALCTLDAMTRILLMSGGLLRWNTFNYLLLGVSLLYLPLLVGLRSIHLRLLLAFSVVLILGLLLSNDLLRGSYDALAFLSVFGLFVYFARASRAGDIWFGLALATSTLSAVIATVFFRHSRGFGYVDPNAWSAAPVIGLFAICLGFPSARRHRGGQLILAVLAGINTTWVFFSGSRGALLTALVSLAFLFTMVRGIHRRVVVLGVALVIGLGIVSQFTDLQKFAVHRVQKLIDPKSSLESRTSDRSTLMLGGLHLFEQNPVLGVGTGGFVPAMAQLAGPEAAAFRSAGDRIAHSGWIKVLAENGLVGGLLFATLIASFGLTGLRSRDRDLKVIGLLTTTVLSALFLGQEFQGKPQWFLVAGTIVLLNRPAIEAFLLRRRRTGSVASVHALRPAGPLATTPTTPRPSPTGRVATP